MKPVREIDCEVDERTTNKIVLAVGYSALPFVNDRVWKQTWDFVYSMGLGNVRETIITAFRESPK